MRKSTPIGAGLAAFGLLVLGSLFVSTPAQADVLVPTVYEFGPHSSSTAGGQILEVYGENLYGVVKMTFGDVESPFVFGDDDYGQYAVGMIPAHKAGTVPVVLYLDADTVVTDPEDPDWETSGSAAETTAPAVAGSAVRAAASHEIAALSPSAESSEAVSSAGSTTSSAAATDSTDGTDQPARSDSLDPSGAVDGLIPVTLGNFTFEEPWTTGLKPDRGPTTGGTTFSLSGPFIMNTLAGYCLFEDEASFAATAATVTKAGKVQPFDLQIPQIDMDVYFDGVRATDARVVIDERDRLSIRGVTPAHEAGPSDVTVVFYELGCGDGTGPNSKAAGLPTFDPYDAVFTRADLFTFDDAPVTETTVTELVTVTETVTQQVPVTLDPSTVTVTTTATPAGPQLAATGVDSSTLPKVLAGLVLFLSGTTVLALGRRPRAH